MWRINGWYAPEMAEFYNLAVTQYTGSTYRRVVQGYHAAGLHVNRLGLGCHRKSLIHRPRNVRRLSSATAPAEGPAREQHAPAGTCAAFPYGRGALITEHQELVEGEAGRRSDFGIEVESR